MQSQASENIVKLKQINIETNFRNLKSGEIELKPSSLGLKTTIH
jgi:hypothetical protein